MGERELNNITLFMGSNKDIATIASQLREHFKNAISSDKANNDFLYEIVRMLNGSIVVCSNPNYYEEDGGSLLIKEDGSFEIRLSPVTSYLRDNFTIAHELGHLFLHYNINQGQGEVVEFARFGNGLIEQQANCFAASFLMPEEEFRKVFAQNSSDYYAIAAHFEVSLQAVEVRIKSLRLK